MGENRMRSEVFTWPQNESLAHFHYPPVEKPGRHFTQVLRTASPPMQQINNAHGPKGCTEKPSVVKMKETTHSGLGPGPGKDTTGMMCEA